MFKTIQLIAAAPTCFGSRCQWYGGVYAAIPLTTSVPTRTVEQDLLF